MDHLPLVQAFKSNNLPLNDPQAYRQITEMGRFTKDVRHVSGVDNIFADFLSRIKEENKGEAYRKEAEPEIAAEEVQFQVASLSALADLQESCDEIKLIKSGDKPKQTSFDTVYINGHKIFCEVTSRNRPYEPREMRMQILHSLHQMDHLGEKATVDRVAFEYYWPSMKQDIKNFVKKCDT